MFIECKACGKRYSDRAPSCPFCGAEREGTDANRRFSRQERKVDGRTITSVCDHSEVAKEAVSEIEARGIRLDYSMASLATLDQYVSDTFGGAGLARTTSQWRPDADARRWIALLGSYVGEVVRRRLGGGWADDPDNPKMPLFVRLELDGRAVVLPLERAYLRLKNGGLDGFEDFGNELLKQLGEASPLDEDGMDYANQATLFIQLERFDVGLRFAERAVKCNPTLAEGWLCKGFSESQLDRPHDALRSYENALRRAPADERALIAHIKQQIQELTAGIGNFRRSQELAAVGAERPPSPPESEEPQSDPADRRSDILERAQPARGPYSDAAVAAATPGYSAGEPSGLSAGTMPPLSLQPDALGAPGESARDASPPAEQLRPALRVDPLSATRPREASAAKALSESASEGLTSVGLVSLCHGDFGAAIDELRAHVQREPEDQAAWTLLARAQWLAGDADPALGSTRRVLRLRADDDAAHRLQCRILLSLERYDEALAAAARAGDVVTDAAWVPSMRAEALLGLERYEEAAKAYEAAILRDPTSHQAWLGKGLAERGRGERSAASAALRASASIALPSGEPTADWARRAADAES